MAELLAQSTTTRDRWRKPVPSAQPVVIGRDSRDWSVPWDRSISRRHVRVEWCEGTLLVERLPDAVNPVFFQGVPADRFRLRIGEHFVIGRTSFILVDSSLDPAASRPPPSSVQAFELKQLAEARFAAAEQRIDGLARLPELIARTGDDTDLAARITALLLDAIPRASGAAVVQQESERTPPMRVLRFEVRSRSTAELSPSVRLVQHVWDSGRAELHRWHSDAEQPSPWTERPGTDWAFCLPLEAPPRRWAIYVEGTASHADDADELAALQDDLKFAQIVAHMVSNFCRARYGERHLARLRPFFSPAVQDWLAEAPQRQLEPGRAEVAVLFCDLRGFSRASESAPDLMQLLHRVSRALGVMTTEILDAGGVVGDFHGDAAMGFWGWPIQKDDPVLAAARAALAIRRRLDRAADAVDSHLAGFRAGIGLAFGEAVAGPIGTHDQVKVTVFGPVVNLAARLESLTKVLHAAVLLDHHMAEQLAPMLPPDAGRLRRVARVRIPGTRHVEDVYELLPPADAMPHLPDDAVAAYEDALHAFEQGDWEYANRRLHEVPPGDRVRDWIVGEIVRHDRTPPADWQGVFEVDDR